MSEKIYLRKVERYTVWEASKPIEVNVEALRKCDPPYEGDTNEELLEYLEENVYNEYDWCENETNKEVYGEGESYDLIMQEVYDMEVYSDTRDKFEDSWIELGTPNEEYRKTGRFESFVDNMPKNDW